MEVKDYEAAQICAPSGQTQKEHIIKLDTAKEMAMLERNDKGKQVRRYFIRIEEKYKQGNYDNISTELKAIIMHDRKLQQIDTKVEAVNNDLQHFKMDMPILGLEESKITKAIKKKGVHCLCGKDSNAYNVRSLRGKLYSDLYGELYK